MRKYLVSAIAAVSVVAAASSAQADMAAANKMLSSFNLNLSKSEQAAEMEWFVNAATPFQGMKSMFCLRAFQPIPMSQSSYKNF